MLTGYDTLMWITEADIYFEAGDEYILLQCMMIPDVEYEEYI